MLSLAAPTTRFHLFLALYHHMQYFRPLLSSKLGHSTPGTGTRTGIRIYGFSTVASPTFRLLGAIAFCATKQYNEVVLCACVQHPSIWSRTEYNMTLWMCARALLTDDDVGDGGNLTSLGWNVRKQRWFAMCSRAHVGNTHSWFRFLVFLTGTDIHTHKIQTFVQTVRHP